MEKKLPILITLVIAFFSLAAPLGIVILLARDQAVALEISQASGYARDILRRSEETSDSFLAIVGWVTARLAGDPCDRDNLVLLERASLAASKVQALAFVADNKVRCSSVGTLPVGYDIGPPDYAASHDPSMKIRANVLFPLTGDLTYFVLEKNGIAGFIHHEIPFSATISASDVILGTLNADHRIPMSLNGNIDPEWYAALPEPGMETSFLDEGHVVAIARSTRYNIAAIAAIPLSHLDGITRDFMLRLVPVGLLAGVILALAILYLSRQQLAMPQAIKAALRHDDFYLVYQPIVDLRIGKWVGAEALLRWRRRNGEVVSPDVFLPLVEGCGLMPQLTARVLDLLGRDVGKAFAAFPDFHISFNLAPSDIHGDAIVDQLRALQERTEAGADNLVMEVTERALTRPEKARGVIQQIRELGVLTAVDDFGTGYSSLSYLESFELDFLKIDKFFVDTIDVQGEVATGKVIHHIIAMAKSLRLRMVAEGVETESQKRFLADKGVQYAQGWLFSKPMPFEELLALLPAHAASQR